MSGLKIAVMINNLRTDFLDSLKFTADHGCRGVHMSFTQEYNLNSDAATRKKLLQTVKSYGLEFSAICAWGGGVDLGNPEGLEGHIEEGKRVLQFAVDMECNIWQGHCGIMPHSKEDPKWARFVDSFGKICQYGEKIGARLAIETGPEPPKVLLDMIDEVGSPALCVNYDPANLILWPARYMQLEGVPYNREKAFAEYHPIEGVKVLGKHIIHSHAKDAKVFPEGRREVPLGEGWIDWPKYISYFREIGFDGYFAIEREVGEDPKGDIARAISFLQSL